MPCPTQLLDGRCWSLGPPGQSCSAVCGGAVDVGALQLASHTAVVDHLEALYGTHTTSRDGVDLWCGPATEAMYVFIPEGFRNFGGEGRWHCLHGETSSQVTIGVRSPCVCLGDDGPVAASSSPPPLPDTSWLPWVHHSSPPPPWWQTAASPSPPVLSMASLASFVSGLRVAVRRSPPRHTPRVASAARPQPVRVRAAGSTSPFAPTALRLAARALVVVGLLRI
jgi:hypothetical protein